MLELLYKSQREDLIKNELTLYDQCNTSIKIVNSLSFTIML